MFRTRDFVLLFVTIVFLVMAISATLLGSLERPGSQETALKFIDTEDTEYTAEIYSPDSLSRSDNLAGMRSKIAANESLIISVPQVDPEEIVEDPAEEEITTAEYALLQCPEYNTYSGSWSSKEIESEISEGARVFYKEVVTDQVPESEQETASTSVVSVSVEKQVLVQLPVFPATSAQPTCIGSDVVGIAQDGSLIRNNESGLYGIFGSNTLVGYALDGFPLYGQTDVELDACGGAISATGYGYYVSTGSGNSGNIINCYKANPVSL